MQLQEWLLRVATRVAFDAEEEKKAEEGISLDVLLPPPEASRQVCVCVYVCVFVFTLAVVGTWYESLVGPPSAVTPPVRYAFCLDIRSVILCMHTVGIVPVYMSPTDAPTCTWKM